MKEKLDLSLDNRQIVSLLLGGIVVLGAVFVLGVVVGKKLAEGGAAQTAPNLIAALDQQAATMEKVRAEAKPELTFQKVLTEDRDDDVRVVKAAPKPAAAVEPAAKPEEKPEPKPEAKPEAKPEPEREIVRVQPPPAVQESPPPVVTASVKAPDGAKPSELQAAIAKAQLPPPSPGSFCLQLSATQVRAEADRFAANLQDRGYAPYVVTAEVPGKGTWYRVRLGRFPSKDAASKYLQDFRRETRMEAFIAAN